MEFHITLKQPVADLGAIENAIRNVDPAAQIDIDKRTQNLRVAAHIDATELASVLNRAGYPVQPLQVVQLPSGCCGGCGG